MSKLLTILRWIAHKLSLLVLSLLATTFVLLFSLNRTVIKPPVIQDWLREANTYRLLLDNAFDLIPEDKTSQKESSKSVGDTIDENKTLDPKELIKTVAKAIGPKTLQTQTEGVLTGVDDWLQGTTNRPKFNFTLASRRTAVINGLTTVLSKQYADLPPCATVTLVKAPDNVFDNKCRPTTADIKVSVKKLIDDELGRKGQVFNATGLTGNRLKIDREALESIPQTYSVLTLLPLLMFGGLALLAGLVMLTSKRFDKGLREAGYSLLGISFVTMLGSLIMSRLSSFVPTLSETDKVKVPGGLTAGAQNVMQPLAQAALNGIASQTRLASLLVALLGALALTGGILWRRHKDADTKKKSS